MRQNFTLCYSTFYWNSSYKKSLKSHNTMFKNGWSEETHLISNFFCLFLGLPERPEKGLQWWWFGTGIPWPGSTAGLSWRAGGWARTGIGEEVEVVLGRVLAPARWLMSPFWSWSSPALSSKSVTQQLAAEKQIPKRILPGSTTVKST